jgi:mRNA degradation ribonuclease J1/J2
MRAINHRPLVRRSSLRVDRRTKRLLHGLSALQVKYCRIRPDKIHVLPTAKRKEALEVITVIMPNYLSTVKRKEPHGFRLGEYQADATGELKVI